MKQYLLSVHIDESDPEPPAEELAKLYAAVEAFNTEVREAGAWVFAGGLHPSDRATVVRARDGEVLVTDGPYAETKEQLGGFWVLKADDLDGALAWAKKATVACEGPVEVRPFQDDAED
jgi:hypothetical protein